MSEEAFEDKQERLPWQAPEPMIIVPRLQPRIVPRLHEIGEFNGRFARLIGRGLVRWVGFRTRALRATTARAADYTTP